MPSTVMLSTLRTNALARADVPSATLVSDTELNGYINQAHRRIYRSIASGDGRDQFATSVSFSVSSGTDTYSFATVTGSTDDVMYVHGVDAQIDGNKWRTLRQYRFFDRNNRQDVGGWSLLDRPQYAIVGRQIRFLPDPSGSYTCRMWYTPEPAVLSSDSDTLTDHFGLSEYVELDAAIQVRAKEEADFRQLLALRENVRKQILEDARPDADFPKRIRDVTRHDEDIWR
ncbi:MAG: hypothetical protein GWN58_58665 [Anaerolineae bacterium]|nr:hypothetical protein [Anaerolineae bacterium]